MRLLNVKTLQLDPSTFETGEAPPYAILSHTWETEEITYEDITSGNEAHHQKQGWQKIVGACNKVLEAKLDWIWIDTCCI
jgi:hypothetical protein